MKKTYLVHVYKINVIVLCWCNKTIHLIKMLHHQNTRLMSSELAVPYVLLSSIRLCISMTFLYFVYFLDYIVELVFVLFHTICWHLVMYICITCLKTWYNGQIVYISLIKYSIFVWNGVEISNTITKWLGSISYLLLLLKIQ